MKRFLNLIKKNKLEVWALGLLFAVTIFVRFYGLDRLAFFTYDQARDALFVKRIIVDHKLRLIGPQSSVPGLYTGPLYYYLMVPFLWLFRLNPIGIDFGIALLGTLAVGVFYCLLRMIGNNWPIAWLASLTFALQPQIVSQSRFGWNPNAIPLFALIFIWGLLNLKKEGGLLVWLAVFVSLAFLLQLHYSGICFLPVIFLYLFFYRKKVKFGKQFALSFLVFLTLMSPLLFFELRHNLTNTRAVVGYLQRGAPGEIPPPPFLSGLLEKTSFLLAEMIFGLKKAGLAAPLLSGVILGLSILAYFKKRPYRQPLLLLLLWLFVGLLVASSYRGSFFAFYLTFLYPVGFLLLATTTLAFYQKQFWYKSMVILVFVLICFLGWRRIDILSTPTRTIADLQAVAGLIAHDAPTEKTFNLAAVLSGERFDYNAVDYRYFVETFYQKKALDWEPADYENAQTLYLIADKKQASPLEINAMEVIKFQPKKVLQNWQLPKGIFVYKLGK